MIIGLCDDSDVQLNYIKSLITSWMDQRNIKCDLWTYHSAEALLFEHTDHYPFDLLILDIQMGEMNGMELAKKIRAVDQNVMIIFLTGLRDYVYEGYEVGALRYLLKPLKEDQFLGLLDEALHRTRQENQDWYIFTYDGETVKLNYEDILYIEAQGHYIHIISREKSYEIKKNISQILKELDSPSFFNTHRSYLVNLKHVEKINRADCLMSNGVSIPVSRSNYKAFNEAFIQYYRGYGL